MIMFTPLSDPKKRAQAQALLRTAHALVAETERLAEQIAALTDLEPDCDEITDAVWANQDPTTALTTLMTAGLKPAPARWVS